MLRECKRLRDRATVMVESVAGSRFARVAALSFTAHRGDVKSIGVVDRVHVYRLEFGLCSNGNGDRDVPIEGEICVADEWQARVGSFVEEVSLREQELCWKAGGRDNIYPIRGEVGVR